MAAVGAVGAGVACRGWLADGRGAGDADGAPLLARNGVAHRWIDTDTDPLGGLLVEYCGLGVERPVAVVADGSQLPAPVDFVEPEAARNDEEPEQAKAAEGRRIGVTAPGRPAAAGAS